MKAFWLSIPAISADIEIVAAGESAGKLRYAYLLGVGDIYRGLKFEHIRIRRAPEFDSLAAEYKGAAYPAELGSREGRETRGCLLCSSPK